MTRRVPISRCVRCVHYRGGPCPLEDLDPCRFQPTPEAEDERAKNIYLVCCIIVAIAVTVLAIIFC